MKELVTVNDLTKELKVSKAIVISVARKSYPEIKSMQYNDMQASILRMKIKSAVQSETSNNNTILVPITGLLTMSSNEIAELTSKRHDHVMRDIRKQLDEQGIGHPKYGGTYKSVQGKDLPCFNLDYDQTMILLTGYSIPMRAKVVKRWNELEKQVQNRKVEIVPSYQIEDPIKRAERWIEEQKKTLLLEQENSNQRLLISGLTEDIATHDKLNIIKRVVKKGGGAINKRYSELYKVFLEQEHIDLKVRCANYNKKTEKKKDQLSVIRYAEDNGHIDLLYKYACKLFSQDIEDVRRELEL